MNGYLTAKLIDMTIESLGEMYFVVAKREYGECCETPIGIYEKSEISIKQKLLVSIEWILISAEACKATYWFKGTNRCDCTDYAIIGENEEIANIDCIYDAFKESNNPHRSAYIDKTDAQKHVDYLNSMGIQSQYAQCQWL